MVLYRRGRNKYFQARVLTSLSERQDDKIVQILKCYCQDNTAPELSQLTDSSQATLLHYAAQYGNPDTVKYLLDCKCKIDAQDHLGKSPLMLAVQGQHEKVLEVLLKANADIHLTDLRGKNSLQMIFDLKAKRFSMLRKFFQCANWQKIIKGIIPGELVKKLDKIGYTPIDILQWGSTELMRAFLTVKNVNDVCDAYDGQTLLHLAVKMKEIEMAKVLIECGANADALDYFKATPLYYVYYNKSNSFHRDEDLQMFKVIMSRATSLTASIYNGFMQISGALQCGNAETVKIILNSNVDLNTSDVKGNTVLHYLSGNCNVDLSKLTRGRKLDVNVRNSKGCTPLHEAAQRNSFDAIKFLLENGAVVDAVTTFGETALYLVFHSYGAFNKRSMEVLLEHGADPQKYCDNLSRYGRSLTTAKPVLARLAVVQGLGTKITEMTRSEVDVHLVWIEYFGMCQRQVKRMKEITIYEKVNLFQFLTESQKKVTAYVRNEELVFGLEKAIEEFEVKSPYPELLRSRLARAIQWADLKDKAVAALLRLINLKINIHYFAAEYIVDYLNNRDMDNLYLVWND